uniref:Putative tail protein n=2 Tax=viral metagenome TaxID=1070528 RepID=A0A6M3L7Z6_9ZZZZ
MAYKYVEYSYPVTHNFEKHIVYANQNCKIYFAMKKEYESSWVYFAGNGTNTLNAGKKLTQYTSETDAQTYYLNAVRDSDSKILVILPAVFQAKFVRLYVESGQSTTVYEWIPSTRLVAHEIISGTLDLTDELSSAPLIRVTKSSVDRLKVGNFTGSTYGIVGFDSSSATIFELSDARRNIGGWDFNASQFTKNNVIISSSGRVRLGSGNDTAQLDSVHPTYRLWIGNASPTAAPFKVTKAGKMFASGVDISGTLAASSITAREIAFRTVTHNNIVMNTLTATEFSANSITATIIRSGAIVTSKIAAGSVTSSELSVGNLSAINANLGTVTAGIAKSSDDKLTIDFNNKWLKVWDAQATPILRVYLGYIA